MKQTISKTDFNNAFHNMGRGDQFSDEALDLLFDYFEEYENETGEEMELDVIAICCDYMESTWQEIASDWNLKFDDDASDEEKENIVIDFLQENTVFIGKTNAGLVYQAF